MKKIARNLAFFLLFSLIAFSLPAQAEFELEAFDGVAVTGNIDVILEEGDSERAVVEAEGIPASEVTVKVSRGVLKLKLINSIFYKEEEVTVYVTYRNLRSIKAHAGARVEARNPVSADQLEVRATSGARAELEVAVNALEGGATEGGVVSLNGRAESQDVNAATGGQWEAFELDCARAYIRANTGGRAEVTADELLEASANTGGTIEYKGDPAKTTIKSVISGNVHKVGK